MIERRAVAWLSSSFTWFDPQTYAATDRAGRLAARKALVDLASLLACRARLGPQPMDDHYLDLVSGLARIAKRRSHLDLVARNHRSLWLHGLIHAALRLCGREDPELGWMMEQAVASGYAVSWERLPFRYLDYLHFLGLGGVPHALRPAESAFRFTLLDSAPNVAELTDEDVYAITHTVFFTTDYGLGTPTWPPDFDERGARELIETLLAHHRYRRHADLVAELIISAVALGDHGSGEVGLAWEYLRACQSAGGSVAAPEHLVSRTIRGDVDDAGYREWRACYHTTIVVALAALVTSGSAERDPGCRVADSRTAGGALRGGDRKAADDAVDRAVGRARAWMTGDVICDEIGPAVAPEVGSPLLQLDGPSRRGLLHWVATLPASQRRDTLAWLTAELLDAVRAYRLGTAASLILALLICGEREHRVVRDSVWALIGQQRMDGSFGYWAADAEDQPLTNLRRSWTAEIVRALSCFAKPGTLEQTRAAIAAGGRF